jgi:chorismate synthase
VHTLVCPTPAAQVSAAVVESNPVRTADAAVAVQMADAIREARSAGDSLGGVVACTVRNCPVGLGDPVFDKLEATLGHAMLSIPACKGFEIGSGFAAVLLKGSEHNDPFYMESDRVRTRTNNSGGIQGGISNGESIDMRLAFKPTATLMLEQATVNDAHQETTLRGKGRHDACVLPRAVPVVEAMAWIVLCDHLLHQRAISL